MSYLQSGTPLSNGSALSVNLTVPAGVTASHWVLIQVTGSATTVNEASPVFTPSKSGVTFTTLVAPTSAVYGLHMAVFKATGLVAGDVVNITLSSARQVGFAHHYFDTDFATVGVLGTRAGTSGKTVVAPSITTTAGQRVYVVATERSVATASLTPLSITNADGETVTTDYAFEATTFGGNSFVLGHFAATDTTAGDTTVTYNVAGTSMAAFLLAETAPVAPTPTLTSARAGGVSAGTARFVVDCANATDVKVRVGTNTALDVGTVTSSGVTPDADGLASVSVSGLMAGTDYQFGVLLNDTLQTARGTFRTSQVGAYSFSFAAASCAANGADPVVLDAIRTRVGASGKTAEFFTHLGDLHYRERNTTNTATILADYREVLARPKHQAFTAAIPWAYTWSDHELGPDNSDSTSLGAGVLAANRGVYGRYFPTYPLPAVNTDGAPYFSWVQGRVRFIVTDGRSYMSAIAATDNSGKTKLGTVQKQWLKDETAAAKAAGQVIVWFHEDGGWTSSSAFVGDDTWAAYTTERSELVTYWTTLGVLDRMLIVHGDFHAMYADDGTNSPGGIPVVCASPLAQTWYLPTQARHSVGVYPAADPGGTINQYGWFDVVDTGGPTVQVVFTGYSNDGTSDTSRVTMTRALATTPKGAATGATTYTGAAAGTRTPKAAAAGTTTRLGTAAGQRTSKATGTGATVWVGTATGVAPTVGGAQGTATGTRTYTGTATGTRTPKGTASGTSTWSGTSTGTRQPKGAATGSTARIGTAAGVAPVVGGKTGTAAGSTVYTGTGVGKRSPKATATGATVWVGTAAGAQAPSGSGVGATVWAGTASGSATGASDYRDIDVTAGLEPRGKTATLAARNMHATMTPRSATASLEDA